MAFGLYTLIVVGVLFANAVAVINERFLRQCSHYRRTFALLLPPPHHHHPLTSVRLPLSPPSPSCALSVGWDRPTVDSPPTVKNRILTLLYGDVKLLLQMPLIWINLVVIALLIVFG